MEKKSHSFANSAAIATVDGTSTMMPISTGGTPSSARTCSATSFAARRSSSVAIIGNMIFTGPVTRRAVDGAELRQKQLGLAQAKPDAAHAEERIVLLRLRQIRHDFVAADVERADDERQAVERLRHRAVGLELLVLGRRRVALEKEKLGAQQADAFGAGFHGRGGFGGFADVGHDFDAMAVGRASRAGSGRRVPPRAGAACRSGKARADSRSAALGSM